MSELNHNLDKIEDHKHEDINGEDQKAIPILSSDSNNEIKDKLTSNESAKKNRRGFFFTLKKTINAILGFKITCLTVGISGIAATTYVFLMFNPITAAVSGCVSIIFFGICVYCHNNPIKSKSSIKPKKSLPLPGKKSNLDHEKDLSIQEEDDKNNPKEEDSDDESILQKSSIESSIAKEDFDSEDDKSSEKDNKSSENDNTVVQQEQDEVTEIEEDFDEEVPEELKQEVKRYKHKFQNNKEDNAKILDLVFKEFDDVAVYLDGRLNTRKDYVPSDISLFPRSLLQPIAKNTAGVARMDQFVSLKNLLKTCKILTLLTQLLRAADGLDKRGAWFEKSRENILTLIKLDSSTFDSHFEKSKFLKHPTIISVCRKVLSSTFLKNHPDYTSTEGKVLIAAEKSSAKYNKEVQKIAAKVQKLSSLPSNSLFSPLVCETVLTTIQRHGPKDIISALDSSRAFYYYNLMMILLCRKDINLVEVSKKVNKSIFLKHPEYAKKQAIFERTSEFISNYVTSLSVGGPDRIKHFNNLLRYVVFTNEDPFEFLI